MVGGWYPLGSPSAIFAPSACGSRTYSSKVQQRTLTTADHGERPRTGLPGAIAIRAGAPLVRDEEAQREPGTAALTWLSLVCGSIDGGHVELLHAEHSLHGSIAASLVRVAHQLGVPGRSLGWSARRRCMTAPLRSAIASYSMW